MEKTSTGLDENIAGLLCYVLGWISGIVFLLLDLFVIKTVYMLILVYSLAVLLPAIGLSVRRLHDTGLRGWWLFISLIPFKCLDAKECLFQ
ncbi:DUF805 domain-containing protein [Chloroflexota bacterium]